MTFARLIADLQDAWRQAMADGPKGAGQRGWIRVRREMASVEVLLCVRRERYHASSARALVALDADVEDVDVSVGLLTELLRTCGYHFRSATEEAFGEIGWRCGEGEILYLRDGGFVRL